MLVLHNNGKWCLGMYACYGIVVYSAFGGFPSSSLTKCILVSNTLYSKICSPLDMPIVLKC